MTERHQLSNYTTLVHGNDCGDDERIVHIVHNETTGQTVRLIYHNNGGALHLDAEGSPCDGIRDKGMEDTLFFGVE